MSNLSRDNVNEGVQGQKQAASCLPESYYSFESDYMSLHFNYIQWFLAQLSMDTSQDKQTREDSSLISSLSVSETVVQMCK